MPLAAGRTSEDAPTPRAQWNPNLESTVPPPVAVEYLSPDMAPPLSRPGSRKGKGRAMDDARDGGNGEGTYGYEEPEYLTVRRHAQRTRSADGQESQHDAMGGYSGRGDLEVAIQGAVGNRNGVGVVDLESAGAAYPPVSEEDAEERRIKDVSFPSHRRAP